MAPRATPRPAVTHQLTQQSNSAVKVTVRGALTQWTKLLVGAQKLDERGRVASIGVVTSALELFLPLFAYHPSRNDTISRIKYPGVREVAISPLGSQLTRAFHFVPLRMIRVARGASALISFRSGRARAALRCGAIRFTRLSVS